MSEFEEEFKKLRKGVEENISRILELIKSSSLRILEIEGKIGLEKTTPVLWEAFKEVKDLKHKVKQEMLEARGNFARELRDLREKIREASAGEPRRLAEELEENFEELREFFEEKFEEAEDSLNEFLDRVEEAEDSIRDRIRELKRGVRKEIYMMGFKVPEVKIPDIGKLVEESLSKAWTGASMIVSSVRLPRADLDLIDALVEAGIFKSRNEGIAFFAHRGIEASSEWLNRIKEKLGEIRRLQEEARKEIEGK